ncbi:E3 ubiquitin-protein ligase FANCL [Elephas maximus indicus]|uniref:E3 ubiquitin-protein ligase FANCL n=1 Tax=Elephas maximus indicus TaxID=99487 RepID=UPI0021163D22|nr:E3 ubiquitin-protein ligase FANCL [Elephas maximus indicus]
MSMESNEVIKSALGTIKAGTQSCQLGSILCSRPPLSPAQPTLGLHFRFRPRKPRGVFPPRPGFPPRERGRQRDCACARSGPASKPPAARGRRALAVMDTSLLRQCPLLLPQNREKTVYEGFISAQGRDFHLKILLPEDLQMKNARLLCSWQLKTILNGYHQIVQQRMQHSPDLVSFMMELKMVLEVALKNKQELHGPPPPPQFYSRLIQELGALGWDKVVYVDPCFNTFKLKAKDASGREHLIAVKLKAKYPAESPDCFVDFPVPFPVSWTSQSSLKSIHSQFLAALDSLKAFWDIMDEIDEKTWVLEPEKPTRSATTRRIALGNNTSINIEVDPRHPTMLPECRFLGADHVVKPLGLKLSRNIHLWDPENTLLQNLKDVLEIDFPARGVLEKSDFTMDCGICYAYQLDGAIPDQVCDNPQCGQPFHQLCLYEWLRGLLTSRQSFNIIFGECPYCSKPIMLKMSGRKP